MLNDIIKMNRGDTGKFPIRIAKHRFSPDFYKLIGNDKVYFGLMEANSEFEDSIIKKIYTAENQDENGYITIKLEPSETEKLLSGVYYYSVKLEKNHVDEMNANIGVYEVKTIINKTKFIILE